MHENLKLRKELDQPLQRKITGEEEYEKDLKENEERLLEYKEELREVQREKEGGGVAE